MECRVKPMELEVQGETVEILHNQAENEHRSEEQTRWDSLAPRSGPS